NPEAWHPRAVTAQEIATPGPRNRPIAFPYNKWHTSQWNVDQAAALLVCSADTARAHGVPPDRWTFLVAGSQSDHVVPVSERAVLLGTRPPSRPYRSIDLSAEVAATVERTPCVEGASGPATVATYTVLHDRDRPPRGVAVCDVDGGRRTIATTDDAVVTDELT